MKTFSGCLIIFLYLIITVSASQAGDITKKIIELTNIDEKISAICKKHCEGNRKKGTLTKMTIEPMKEPLFKITGDATLLNKEVIGDGIELFGYTVKAKGFGTLNEKTCVVRIDKIVVDNDSTEILSKMAADEKGKTYKIKNCAELTSDLSN
ncbi:MAG: hypothetical protein ACQ9MH_13190 [Nitrospinales bacterium]